MDHAGIPVSMQQAAALSDLPTGAREQRIIELCDSAIVGLTEARDLDEVLGIRNAAEAFVTYTRKMKAAIEAQNRCQLVVLLAEARIGAELKAAQERGDVATQAQHGAGIQASVQASDTRPATLPDLGIPRQRAAEMKKLAAAGTERINDEVRRATDEGRRPSRRNILNHIPSIAERAPECTRFILWLNTGASFIPSLGSPEAFVARLAEHKMAPQPNQIQIAHRFLCEMAKALEQ